MIIMKNYIKPEIDIYDAYKKYHLDTIDKIADDREGDDNLDNDRSWTNN